MGKHKEVGTKGMEMGKEHIKNIKQEGRQKDKIYKSSIHVLYCMK